MNAVSSERASLSPNTQESSMIIQIRGTSGSGKSTVMKQIMTTMGDWNGVYVEGRKKPLYYISASDWPSTLVLGHYESPCGGCDTIGSAAAVYDLIQSLEGKVAYTHLLCEGLLLSEDTKWTKLLHAKHEVIVAYLTTKPDDCLDRIKQRRKSVGNDKPLNPSNTLNRVGVIERSRIKLTEVGVPTYRLSSVQAPKTIMKWMN